MPTQCAVQRDQAIADQAIREHASLRRRGCGHGVGRNTRRQGDACASIGMTSEAIAPLPVLIQDMAVAQIGDAGAAQLREFGKWRAPARAAQDDIDGVAGAFQRCAVMRRAEDRRKASIMISSSIRWSFVGKDVD